MMICRNKTAVLMLALGLLVAMPLAGLAHSSKIPLGDGKVSTTPRLGYVYSCRQVFRANAPVGRHSGNWIDGGYWYPKLKPTVSGAVKWSGGAKIKSTGNERSLHTHGLPSHVTGSFPVKPSDDAYQYDRNPNRIKGVRVALKMPTTPQIAPTPSCLPMGMIGVALTGAAFYNALDSAGLDGRAHEIQDACGGHPQRRGQYHYHGPSDCLYEGDKAADGHSGLVGYALDGFGIFGLVGADGAHLTNADLDACHGHTEPVLWDGKVTAIYHYHLTDEYPYTLGCFMGSPVQNSYR